MEGINLKSRACPCERNILETTVQIRATMSDFSHRLVYDVQRFFSPLVYISFLSEERESETPSDDLQSAYTSTVASCLFLHARWIFLPRLVAACVPANDARWCSWKVSTARPGYRDTFLRVAVTWLWRDAARFWFLHKKLGVYRAIHKIRRAQTVRQQKGETYLQYSVT